MMSKRNYFQNVIEFQDKFSKKFLFFKLFKTR